MIANKVAPVLVPPAAAAAASVPGVVAAPADTQAASAQPVAAQGGSVMPEWNWMGWTNPMLDESWTPPPPPTTPPEHLEPEDERQALSSARAEQRGA